MGGYEDPCDGGRSLQMWSDFFPKSTVYGVDVHPKTLRLGKRIKVFQGDQRDAAFLNDLVDKIGEVDIIIDDASHLNDHTIRTFEILFPRLKDGGIYVIEDLNNSYWPSHGGDSRDLNNPATIMNFLKRRVDGLNHKEFVLPDYKPDYEDLHITALHFYHNLVFIYKGHNDENGIRDVYSPDWLAMTRHGGSPACGSEACVDGELVTAGHEHSPVDEPSGKLPDLMHNGSRTVIEINKTIAEKEDDAVSTTFALLVRGTDGTIRYWNKGAERLYGWRPDDTLGQRAHHLLQTVFPKPLPSIETELVQTGRWEGELVHKRRDGSEVRVASQWELHD